MYKFLPRSEYFSLRLYQFLLPLFWIFLMKWENIYNCFFLWMNEVNLMKWLFLYYTLLCWRRLLRVPWTSRRSNQSILKEVKSCVFIEGTDAEAPVLWPPHAKSWLFGKDADAGRDWGQEEKGMTEDEMVGWHHWLDGHEFE